MVYNELFKLILRTLLKSSSAFWVPVVILGGKEGAFWNFDRQKKTFLGPNIPRECSIRTPSPLKTPGGGLELARRGILFCALVGTKRIEIWTVCLNTFRGQAGYNTYFYS